MMDMIGGEYVRYYYLRDNMNRPFGCVAFAPNGDGTVDRGISLCSVEDRFNRRHARGLAFKRLREVRERGDDVYFGMPLGKGMTNPVFAKELYDVFDESDEDLGVLFMEGETRLLDWEKYKSLPLGVPGSPWKRDGKAVLADQTVLAGKKGAAPTCFERHILGAGKEEA